MQPRERFLTITGFAVTNKMSLIEESGHLQTGKNKSWFQVFSTSARLSGFKHVSLSAPITIRYTSSRYLNHPVFGFWHSCSSFLQMCLCIWSWPWEMSSCLPKLTSKGLLLFLLWTQEVIFALVTRFLCQLILEWIIVVHFHQEREIAPQWTIFFAVAKTATLGGVSFLMDWTVWMMMKINILTVECFLLQWWEPEYCRLPQPQQIGTFSSCWSSAKQSLTSHSFFFKTSWPLWHIQVLNRLEVRTRSILFDCLW